MEVVSRYRSGFLVGESRSGSPEDIGQESFDIGLFMSAWEQRCTAITKTGHSVNLACHLTFQHDNGLGYLEAYHDELAAYLRQHAASVMSVSGRFEDLEGMSRQLISLFESAVAKNGRPATALVDITCCPKYYFLAVLGECISRGLCSRMRFFYAEGDYLRGENESYVFTHGEWEPIIIPCFPGMLDPEKKRFFLPSLGFEGQRALRLVSRYEPDRVSVLLPNPGYNPSYTTEATESNRALIDEYKIPAEQVLKCRAGDAIAAWRILDTPSIHRHDSENTTYLVLGTKPHALGLGLKALVSPEIQIAYNKPQSFGKKDAIFNGVCWTYDIEDLSALP